MNTSSAPRHLARLHQRSRILAVVTVSLGLLAAGSLWLGQPVQAQLFDVIPVDWSNAPSMPTERVIPGVSTSGGKIYVTGGFNGTGPGGGSGNTLNSVEAFNLESGTWETLPSLPRATKGHGQVTTPDGRIWVTGGQLGSTNLATVQVFDPVSNSWSTLASMQVGRFRHGLAVGTNGKIYAIGGWETGGAILSSVEVYDPATDTWQFVASLPAGRTQLTAAGGHNGKIYAIAGYVQTGPDTAASSDDVLEYDPATNTWTPKREIINGSANSATTVAPNGKIWVTGGNFSSGLVQVYDPDMNVWQDATEMPTARFDHGAAFGPDGRLYVVGGNDGTAMLNTMIAGTITEPTPTPTQTPSPTATYSPTPTGIPALYVYVPLVARAAQAGW